MKILKSNCKNTILRNLLVFMLISFQFSCENAIETDIKDEITKDNVFNTVNDLEDGINGVYTVYNPEFAIQFTAYFTDNVNLGPNNTGENENIHEMVINVDDPLITAIYSSNYQVISFANRLLEGADRVIPTTAEEEVRKDRVIGEALALRALAHFELLTYFSTSYDINALAVPYVDYTTIFGQPARNTVGELVANINEDITRAENLIGQSPSVSRDRVSVDMLLALRSRMALYLGNLENAVAFSTELIQRYPLATPQQYFAMFQDFSEEEVIFKAQRRPGDLFAPPFIFFSNNGIIYNLSNGLFDALQESGLDDVRSQVLINPQSSTTNLIVNKYPGSEGSIAINDVKVFRVSEQYLILAEALALQEDFENAALFLNQLRESRKNPNTPPLQFTTIPEAIETILAERRIELAYEGFRFIDLKRTRAITGKGIERDPRDCGGKVSCGISSTDFRFTLPIPQNELDGNPVIREQQNPGY